MIENNPMDYPHSRRCGARNRAGQPCKCPPIRGRRRCRLHGGLSPGAPTGPRNGNYTEGNWTGAVEKERRWLQSLVQEFAKAEVTHDTSN
jgi:glucans biosynthesis protein